ncbi:MAG: hypothetical protein PHO10_09520 [Gemmiger sp.]|nr:hypothetical protein [Gemmiger sp.]
MPNLTSAEATTHTATAPQAPPPAPPATPEGAAKTIHTAPPLPALGALRPSLRGSALAWQGVAACVGLVLGAAQVYGGATPFGLAMAMGCLPGYALAAAVGALVGGLLFVPAQQAIMLAGALLATLLGRRLSRGRFWVGAAAGSGTLLVEQAAAGFGFGVTTAQNAAILCTAVLAVGFGAAIQAMPVDKPRGIGLWLTMLVAGSQQFALYGFAPGLALMALAGLCAAYAGSLEQTAVLAVALAAAFTAASPTLCYAALAVSLGVVGASALCAGERWRCAGVFLAGCALGALSAPGFAGAVELVAGAGCGLLLFLLMPARLLRDIFPPPAPTVEAQGLSGAARRLAGVADTLSDIARTVNAVCERQLPPKGENFDFVVEFAARQVCQECTRREKCWIRGYSTAMDGLYQLKETLESKGAVAVEQLPGPLTVCTHPSDLCGAVNRGYRLWRSRRQSRARAATLRTALTEQYSAMASALAQLAARLGQSGLPDPRKESRVAQLFASIGLDALECSVTSDVAGRTTANVTWPARRFRKMSSRPLPPR